MWENDPLPQDKEDYRQIRSGLNNSGCYTHSEYIGTPKQHFTDWLIPLLISTAIISILLFISYLIGGVLGIFKVISPLVIIFIIYMVIRKIISLF